MEFFVLSPCDASCNKDASCMLAEKILYCNNNQTRKDSFCKRTQIIYLQEYLQKIGAAFFYVEEEYINKDYLTNYSLSYDFSFPSYKKKASRIHFFKKTKQDQTEDEFTEQFKEYIQNYNQGDDQKKSFDASYLGYVVIIPIPNTFLGYTLLKTMNLGNFWGTKNYKVHLFGLEFIINSLACQEQDSNVGACATAAIWTVFQKAAEDYYVNLKSPIEITRDAGLTMLDGKRLLPNEGLNVPHICTAITKNNLSVELTEFHENEKNPPLNYLKKLVHAYSTLGLPVILGIEIESAKDKNLDYHAIAITGYQMDETKIIPSSFPLYAENMTTLYLHDDQFGPFIEAVFPKKVEKDTFEIKTSWVQKKYTQDKYSQSKISTIIIPVFKKVRIPYQDIEGYIKTYDKFIKEGIFPEYEEVLKEAQWNIYVDYSSNFKKQIRELDNVTEYDSSTKLNILELNLPKYVWVATLRLNKICVVTCIFDATGLRNAPNLLHVVFYLKGWKKKVAEQLETHSSLNGYIAEFCNGVRQRGFLV